MNKELIKLLETKFKEKLQAKTNWGRNDVWNEFQKAISETAIELLDKSNK